jgi:hypothetical protein
MTQTWFDVQYDRAIAPVHRQGENLVIGRACMSAVIVLIISAITFRDFCLCYWRSMILRTSA